MTKRLTCSVRYFCLGAFLIFLGSILLCSLGFTIVLPHVATRHWIILQCHVINSSYVIGKCSCTRHIREDSDVAGCSISYPCLQIIVSYELPTRHSENYGSLDNKTVTEYVDNNTQIGVLYRSWDDAFIKTCTIHECGDEQWNIKQTDRFRLMYGEPKLSYKCYLDPSDITKVILARTPTSHMVHALVWPCICLLFGLLLWLCLWLGCWEVDMENYSHPSIDRSRGLQSYS